MGLFPPEPSQRLDRYHSYWSSNAFLQRDCLNFSSKGKRLVRDALVNQEGHSAISIHAVEPSRRRMTYWGILKVASSRSFVSCRPSRAVAGFDDIFLVVVSLGVTGRTLIGRVRESVRFLGNVAF